MIRRVIINHIDPEFVESYMAASKDLLAALKEKEGLLEGSVLICEDDPTLVFNIETWEDAETAGKAHMTETFASFMPRLRGFKGNETYVLKEI